MCKYKKSEESLPYPRVLWLSECGYQLAIMEGYKFENYKNSSGEQTYSVRTEELNNPKGNCMKCKEGITI